MYIKQKSIKNISAYISNLKDGQIFKVGLEISQNNIGKIVGIGFPANLENGSCIIPMPIGKISDFNVNGKEIVRDDLPKISETKMVYATWNDWHGYSHSGFVPRRYKKYPRDLIMPPSEYLYVASNSNKKYITSVDLTLVKDDEEKNLFIINLFLEIFGECQILDQQNAPFETPQIKRLNWDVLPPGEYPWDKAKNHIEKITAALKDAEKKVVEYRLRKISAYKPDFLAIGKGGFDGYFVLGFKSKNMYVFESIHLGNATYVFKDEWMQLSQMTKKEILDASLHHARVIHNPSWDGLVSRILM